MTDIENVRRIQQAIDGLQMKMSPYRDHKDPLQLELDKANYHMREALKELQEQKRYKKPCDRTLSNN